MDLNDFEIKSGQDLIAVRINLVMPHNVGKAIETLQITNQRYAEVDLLNSNGWDLSLSLATSRKMLAEMNRIAPEVTR